MYTLIEVTTRQHETDFLELPVRLYKGNPWWIRPLDNDIRNVFDPAKNPCFQNGECIRWILKDEAGQCVGRVAAFINRKTCHLDKYSVVWLKRLADFIFPAQAMALSQKI